MGCAQCETGAHRYVRQPSLRPQRLAQGLGASARLAPKRA